MLLLQLGKQGYSMKKLSREVLKTQNPLSLGTIRKEFIDFFNSHGFNGVLKYNKEIMFWEDRIEHTELHKNDFSSDSIFEACLEEIPQIIYHPDYLAFKDLHSISFIKDYTSNHTNIVIRVTVSGDLAYRTMYPLLDATLSHYVDKSHAWKVFYDENDNPIIEENPAID